MNSPLCRGGSHTPTMVMKKKNAAKANGAKGRKTAFKQRTPGYKNVRIERAPVALSVSSLNTPAQSRSMPSSDGKIVVTHREYINDVVGSDAFGDYIASYPVNPGMGATFPWLHHMAFQYEAYRFRELKFQFCPSIPSTTAGRVFMYLDYDAADAFPTTKQAFLSNHGAVSTSAWCPIEMKADSPDLHKLPQHINRYGVLPANLDVKTYDVANLFVASQGIGAALDGVSIGELYVEYTVEFFTPQLNHQAELDSESKRILSGGTVTKAAPFGSAPAIIGGVPLTVDANSVHFSEPGEYLFNLKKVGTGLINTVLTTPGGTSFQLLDSVINGAATSALEQWRIKADGPNTEILFDASGDTTVTATATRIADYLYSLS